MGRQLLPNHAWRPRSLAHVVLMTKQRSLMPRPLVRSRTLAARRRSASLALTTTSSPAASSPILASALDAPSATTPWLTTASRIARLPACWAGASPDASLALSLPKTVLQDALASLLRSLTHAWMSWPKLFRMGLLSELFSRFAFAGQMSFVPVGRGH